MYWRACVGSSRYLLNRGAARAHVQQRNGSKHRGSWSPGWLAFDPFIELFRRLDFGRRPTKTTTTTKTAAMSLCSENVNIIICERIAMTTTRYTSSLPGIRAGATVAVISASMRAPCPPPPTPSHLCCRIKTVCLLYNNIIIVVVAFL